MHHLPPEPAEGSSWQVQARRGRQLLHRRPQLLPLRLAKGGGEPPVCRISGLWALPHKPMHHLPPEPAEGSSWPGPGPPRQAAAAPPPSTPPAAPRQGRGGTTGLLEYQGSGPSLTKGRRPSSDGVRVPFQRRRRGRCPPALGQQQDGVPPLPLPWRRCQDHPSTQILDFHLPLFQRPIYLPHAHHLPPQLLHSLAQFLHKFIPFFCVFHLGFGLVPFQSDLVG